VTAYRLVHRPDLDATGYSLPDYPGAQLGVIDCVAFAIAQPADAHEATLALTLTRAAWEAQGSPGELFLSLTAPTPEESS
jgi:hypothetical protein